MLEICPTLTTSKPRVEIHPLGIGGKEDPVRMVFDTDTDSGPGVVVSMADMRERFRLTANVVDIVPPTADLHARRGRAPALGRCPPSPVSGGSPGS